MAADVLVGKLKVFYFPQLILYFKNVDFNVLLNRNKKTILKNVKEANKNTPKKPMLKMNFHCNEENMQTAKE